jgi:dTDP-4-amino-4,6-dideoxygalactose transaminase
MIPLFKVGMSGEAQVRVGNVLASGFIGQGPVVEEFEDKLWKELKTKTRPVTVNSCTSAIDLALELCGVGPGDEVIATPQTCFASNIHIIHRKARIRWADIDPITGLIDPNSVKKLIAGKTKAIVAVNWAGKFVDYGTLKTFGVPVIEDAAHTWDTFLTEDVVRGDYICYSFQAIKFLTTADGGIVICPPDKEADARILRWYGLDRTKNESFRCTQNITQVGFKYHMNDVNASIGLANLPVAHQSVQQSRLNSKYLINKVNNPFLTLPEWDNTCSYWLFSMHVRPGLKDHFTKYLADNGIASSPVHFRNDRYDTTIKFAESTLPGVNLFTETQLCIPNGFWLTQEDLDRIVKVLNEYKG